MDLEARGQLAQELLNRLIQVDPQGWRTLVPSAVANLKYDDPIKPVSGAGKKGNAPIELDDISDDEVAKPIGRPSYHTPAQQHAKAEAARLAQIDARDLQLCIESSLRTLSQVVLLPDGLFFFFCVCRFFSSD